MIELDSADFWKPRSIDEIVREQQISPAMDLLALTDWPDEESADKRIEYIYGQRRADRMA